MPLCAKKTSRGLLCKSLVCKFAKHNLLIAVTMSNKIEITEKDLAFLKIAVEKSIESVNAGGGPFGAVIVKDDEIIAVASNSVTIDNDPTAHAEVNAIREACKKIGSFKLDGCRVYSSCEPCPMCLSALYWAGVAAIYYGNTKEDAAAIDFSDKFIYDELDLPKSERAIPCIRIADSGAIEAFRAWEKKSDKTAY